MRGNGALSLFVRINQRREKGKERHSHASREIIFFHFFQFLAFFNFTN